MLSRRIEQILEIIEKRRRSVNFLRCRLNLEQSVRCKDRLQLLEHLPAIHSQQHRALAGAIGHAQLDAHEETIELRFRERKSANLMLWVLCCDHEEGLGQFVS